MADKQELGCFLVGLTEVCERTKLEWSKCEGGNDFIERFINQATSHLVNREMLPASVGNGRVLWAKGVLAKGEKGLFQARTFSLGRGEGWEGTSRVLFCR